MIGVSVRGDSKKTSDALRRMSKQNIFADLNRYGALGVEALSKATPVDSSITAQSWKYRVVQERNGPRVEWYNTHVVDGVNVAVLIQYGHATRGGTYISGRDYINPAIQPLFDQFVAEIWKKVKT
jgi:hypothetical protein